MVVHGALDPFWTDKWAQDVQNVLVELHCESVQISRFRQKIEFDSGCCDVGFSCGSFSCKDSTVKHFACMVLSLYATLRLVTRVLCRVCLPHGELAQAC